MPIETNKLKINHFIWAIVFFSSLGWTILSDHGLKSKPPVSLPGIGLSLEYHLQFLFAQVAPYLSFILHVLVFPIVAFYLAMKIIKIFMDDTWSIILALLFFSNNIGLPFHLFLTEALWGDLSIVNHPTLKITDISTIFGLSSLLLLLRPRNIYQDESLALFVLLSVTVFLDSLDAYAISLIYIVSLGLKYYFYPEKRKISAIYFVCFAIVWAINLTLTSTSSNQISYLQNLSVYIGLYFILPFILFTVSIASLRIDYYQVMRRFSGIVIVFISEVTVFVLHYTKIFTVQLSEVQFNSIFPFFHILYFVPILFWILNSNAWRHFFYNEKKATIIKIKTYLYNGFIIAAICVLAFYNFIFLLWSAVKWP